MTFPSGIHTNHDSDVLMIVYRAPWCDVIGLRAVRCEISECNCQFIVRPEDPTDDICRHCRGSWA